MFDPKKIFISHSSRINLKLGAKAWQDEKPVPGDEVQATIATAIKQQMPYLSGKMGSNEQWLVHWHSRIPLGTGALSVFVPPFTHTEPCLTNAGAFPRNRESYHQIGMLFESTLSNIDLLTIFGLSGEYQIRKRLAPDCKVTKNLSALPYHHANPWSKALAGKKVLVVSPFADTIAQQYLNRTEIWPENGLLPALDLITERFPYLIDLDKCIDWRTVYADCQAKIENTDFDVALMGCGFMGILLADLCKRKGKVGIHMGGALQVLFGITGRRYEEQAWFAKFINSAWVRPLDHEVPECASKIEGGCYW